jgi:hypothetical protein
MVTVLRVFMVLVGGDEKTIALVPLISGVFTQFVLECGVTDDEHEWAFSSF